MRLLGIVILAIVLSNEQLGPVLQGYLIVQGNCDWIAVEVSPETINGIA